ncbi:FAD-dependent oxidoreductase [Parapusillimonas sp. SGNA-6]|nr:FAD-dependent oxidoreductase [Parapusillimonas sp. SGNA-6]
MSEQIVIVGAGHGGFQTVVALRQYGYVGKIVLIESDTHLPYQRPPLSKAFMKGDISAEALCFKPERYYGDHNIERISKQATAIDRPNRRVVLDDGSTVPYMHLILATGACNRPLTIPGSDLDGVHGLRTLTDAAALSHRLKTATSVAVIGAGFIGLEFAAVARAAGATVHVIELAGRPMARAVSEPVSAFFTDALSGTGIHFHFNQTTERIIGVQGSVTGVETSQGESLEADLVVYGIGVTPNAQLASEAGIKCANGIIVDECLTSSDPDVSAIGDCASFPQADTGELIRLESVQNAADQARCVAKKLTKGAERFAVVPWFWSEQGNLKLQIAGLSTGHDQTLVLGDPAANRYSVLCFKNSVLIAVESVNAPADHMIARRILSSTIRPSYEEACSKAFTLKSWEASTKESPAQHEAESARTHLCG